MRKIIAYSLTLVSLLSLGACSKENPTLKNEYSGGQLKTEEINSSFREGNGYTGEEIFRGIFFGEGRLLALIPEIKQNKITAEDLFTSQSQISEIETTRNTIVQNINNSNPTFFSEFHTKMTSGDPFIIQQAIAEAGPLVLDAIAEGMGYTTPSQKESFKAVIGNKVQSFKTAYSNKGINPRDISLLKQNIHHDIDDQVDADKCLVVWGVGVAVAVAVAAAVEVAVATDQYVAVTESFWGVAPIRTHYDPTLETDLKESQILISLAEKL
jgi:SdpC family antimicrobial peptide